MFIDHTFALFNFWTLHLESAFDQYFLHCSLVLRFGMTVTGDLRYSGDLCPIDVTTIDDAEDLGTCLTLKVKCDC